MEKDEFYMRLALEEAKAAMENDEVPVGSVLVCDGSVVSRGHNAREANLDILGHAEIETLKEAAKKRGSWKLRDCVLYVTLEPCPMCASALQQAGIKRIVYGAKDEKNGACGGLFDFFLTPRLNHYPLLSGGVLEEECARMLREYFSKKRQK